MTPSPRKPEQEIDICRGNTSFLVHNVKEGFKTERCNVKLFGYVLNVETLKCTLFA